MPKRVGYLYEKMLDRDLILATIRAGSRGKRRRRDVRRVLARPVWYADRLIRMLKNGTFRPTPPRIKHIRDSGNGKVRTIQITPYWPDGLVQQLCVEVMRPVIMRGMYRWSCASIPKRGTHDAGRYVRRALDADPKGSRYCLKMDIRQFYPSVEPGKVVEALRRRIKDERFLELIAAILRNGGNGLAIGSFVSQWAANFYLESMDGAITRMDGVKHYVRYMDDMVLLGSSKRRLHRARRAVADILQRLGLTLKGNWQVFPVARRGIDFVGFRYFPAVTLLRKRNWLKLQRQCRKAERYKRAGRTIPKSLARGLDSRLGQLRHCDTRRPAYGNT